MFTQRLQKAIPLPMLDAALPKLLPPSIPFSRYNAAIMRYERHGNSYLCVGLRGFIYEGLSGIAPVARR